MTPVIVQKAVENEEEEEEEDFLMEGKEVKKEEEEEEERGDCGGGGWVTEIVPRWTSRQNYVVLFVQSYRFLSLHSQTTPFFRKIFSVCLFFFQDFFLFSFLA